MSQSPLAGHKLLVLHGFKISRGKRASVPPGLWRDREGQGADTAQQNADLAGTPGSTRESDVLRRGGRGGCACFASLCPCSAGESSTLLGSKVPTLDREKLSSALYLGEGVE